MTPQITKMLICCTRRATASTNSMAAMAPANAARISVNEPVSRPRFKRRPSSAPRPAWPAGNAHDERPGNRVGKKRLQQIPATESAAPSSTTMTARGSAAAAGCWPPALVPRPAGPPRCPPGERNAAPEQVERKQRQQGRRHGEICNCHAFEVCMRGSPLRRAAMVWADRGIRPYGCATVLCARFAAALNFQCSFVKMSIRCRPGHPR